MFKCWLANPDSSQSILINLYEFIVISMDLPELKKPLFELIELA